MTIKKFLEEKLESAKTMVSYHEKNLTKAKEELFMLEQLYSQLTDK